MTEYLDMWKNYINFTGRTSVRGYWMAFLVNITVIISIIVVAVLFPFLMILIPAYSVSVVVPELALAIRRLRDAGKAWYNIFWPFLPVIGTVILLVLLCRPSVE